MSSRCVPTLRGGPWGSSGCLKPLELAGAMGLALQRDHSHPASVNTPPPSPPRVHKAGNSHFHPEDSLSVGELGASFYFFFLNDNFPPLYFVAKNHPGLSRREGRKLCSEREGKIISLGHRHSHLSSVCKRRSGGWENQPGCESRG